MERGQADFLDTISVFQQFLSSYWQYIHDIKEVKWHFYLTIRIELCKVTTMKFVKRLLVNIPDQVLSTVILFGIVYVVYRGIASIIMKPPAVMTCITVIGVGILFGIITTFKQTQHD